MKKDKALHEAKKNMIKWVDSITKYKDIIEQSETMDDYMKAKKQVMLNAADIPLGIHTCVHCLMNINLHGECDSFHPNCENCTYKDIHDFCKNEGSTWLKIYRAKRIFLDELQKY